MPGARAWGIRHPLKQPRRLAACALWHSLVHSSAADGALAARRLARGLHLPRAHLVLKCAAACRRLPSGLALRIFLLVLPPMLSMLGRFSGKARRGTRCLPSPSRRKPLSFAGPAARVYSANRESRGKTLLLALAGSLSCRPIRLPRRPTPACA